MIRFSRRSERECESSRRQGYPSSKLRMLSGLCTSFWLVCKAEVRLTEKILCDGSVYCKLTNWLFLRTYSVKCYLQQVSLFSLVLSAPGSETCNICKEIVVTAFWQKRRYFKRCILWWHTSEMSGENLRDWILPQSQPVLIFFNFVFLAFFCICCVIWIFLYGFKRLSLYFTQLIGSFVMAGFG